ncbi:major capsid protein [Erinaceus europaeus papillomavirus 1]|uniref:Major capsid protein L1 n=1 Tax=Erinaceus europaeus papillomavirus 1 TaxID=445217 RepID=B0L7E0_9PAPI|nr:major capsid protein [Erinaceus europaeus papillomavirus 1]ABQ66263.2 major capsid protein [Erinaceus europaeus papillomavirus 1]
MALWLPGNKVYLPPPAPVARVLNTDDFIRRTNVFYHANSDRLLTVGHPYYPVKDNENKVVVPKVSGNQYRVFRLLLPDPNKFALADASVFNPDNERLVWACRGVEIGRGQPLGIGSTGHPLFNKLKDTENPNTYPAVNNDDDRQNVSMDPKQTQLFIIGCRPAMGEHWDKAKACADSNAQTGDCPPIELVNSTIEDGNMCDIGFGNMNFRNLQEDKSDSPLDILTTTCKYPDFLKMSNEKYGDQMWFFAKREQLYARHFFTRAGTVGDKMPNATEPSMYYISAKNDQAQKNNAPHIYFPTPSGSLVSSDAQLFNRPFWLQRAQGHNNGICWGNQVFLTIVDNTRNTNFTISMTTEGTIPQEYEAKKFKQYLRHVEEYEVSLIFQLCKVPLDAEVLAHINAMDPDILEEWNLGFVPSGATSIEDQYRFISSLATRCPDQNPPKEKVDPYEKYTFWNVDLRERFSTELSQFPLGRKFLYQTGLRTTSITARRALKRTATPQTKRKTTVKKRKKVTIA